MGMAKLIPETRLPPSLAVLIPITSPLKLTKGPPLFPFWKKKKKSAYTYIGGILILSITSKNTRRKRKKLICSLYGLSRFSGF
mmetsp:Transcript_37072/g.47909  ORF Transcript_37072/g.47909 Transcript_37072/m.47909 type:complete len:83 (+) Transcript_37072:581-829(+)